MLAAWYHIETVGIAVVRHRAEPGSPDTFHQGRDIGIDAILPHMSLHARRHGRDTVSPHGGGQGTRRNKHQGGQYGDEMEFHISNNARVGPIVVRVGVRSADIRKGTSP